MTPPRLGEGPDHLVGQVAAAWTERAAVAVAGDERPFGDQAEVARTPCRKGGIRRPSPPGTRRQPRGRRLSWSVQSPLRRWTRRRDCPPRPASIGGRQRRRRGRGCPRRRKADRPLPGWGGRPHGPARPGWRRRARQGPRRGTPGPGLPDTRRRAGGPPPPSPCPRRTRAPCTCRSTPNWRRPGRRCGPPSIPAG